ncbi:MAG: endopeptidase La [Myxococcota bacterium]
MFPGMRAPLLIGRSRSINAIFAAIPPNKEIFLSAQKDAAIPEPEKEDIFEVGCLSRIESVTRMPQNKLKVMLEGLQRGEITRFISAKPYYKVEVNLIYDEALAGVESEALLRTIRNTFIRHLNLNKNMPAELKSILDSTNDPLKLLDTIATYLNVKLADKQALLGIKEPSLRLEKFVEILENENEILLLERKIKGRVDNQMRKNQREYYLNEKMNAIQRELGDVDDGQSEFQEIKERLEKKTSLTKEARERVEKELKKFRLMTPMSAEATVLRNYIDWVLSLPWAKLKEEQVDIKEAARVLDDDHYGLEKVKERILEYLSVRLLAPEVKGPILCLVGPPGVGKTSLGKSIARATGREFVRLSLGGVRDEAEIRGHRRTYIGALPGKIIQSLKRVETNNPLFLLDEVDKLSSDFRGDPSAALLEVLDPEQNHTFMDHYLDLDYDLSKVMFVTTANTEEGIPPPLRDRMEIIRLAGYTEREKLEITKRYLVPKQLKANGVKDFRIEVPDETIFTIIRRYTREAGVREVERKVASCFRKLARRYLEEGKKVERVELDSALAMALLGVPKYKDDSLVRRDEVGIATGVAWTEFGGDILRVEALLMPGKNKLTITGKLGDVMKESAQAALSYIRSRAADLGLKPDFYENLDIHIHVPEGAVPKDGPSAGITIASALASAFTAIPCRHDVAMTGEITLRGNILPIGGLKEKALAAYRFGIRTVIIPADNEKDIAELPEEVRREMNFIKVSEMEEVLPNVLTAMPAPLETEPSLDTGRLKNAKAAQIESAKDQ